jgi:hypothetical protein
MKARPVLGRLAVAIVAAGVGVVWAGGAATAARGQAIGEPLRSPLGPAEQGAPEFAAGIGYANISIGDSDSPLDSQDGLRFEFGISFAPFPDVPQLRLGGAFGTGIVFDSGQTTVVSSGGLVVATSGDVPLITLEPEARLSWRQRFGDSGFFIEPGIAGGAFIAHLDFEVDEDDFFDDEDDDFDEWDTSLSARAFVNVGVEFPGGAGGVQASYLRAGDLDLGGGTEGDAEEFYIGVFGTFRF